MEIVARRYDPRLGPLGPDGSHARSDSAGRFAFHGLAACDYELRTVATAGYAAKWKIFRAGVDSADIVVARNRTAQVYGTTTGEDGSALAGVEIGLGSAGAETTSSDAAGRYRLGLTVADPERSYTLRFHLPGHHDERVQLEGRKLLEMDATRVDVQLRRMGTTTKVSGTVRSEDGDPVAGETVQLQSASRNTQHMARTDADGAFSMPAVESATDYFVTIHPAGAFDSYQQQGVVVDGPELELSIRLHPVDSGRLSGRIVDLEGDALPGFSLLLQSNRSPGRLLTVSSDDSGNFLVENAPAGLLTFSTQSEPRFVITGIALPADTEITTELMVDWGTLELAGRVRDASGNPVPGAELRLSWNGAHRGTQSTSFRRTVADGAGYFRFTQLGAAPHSLQATAPGYQGVTASYAPGTQTGEVDVELPRGP